MDVEEIIFQFFESRNDLKEKFYDSLHRLIFDGEKEHLSNMLVSYELDIIEYKKKKSGQNEKK